jgi:hypothetical protein
VCARARVREDIITMLKPMLEDYHLLAVSWLFNILAVIIHIWGFSNWYVKMCYVEVTTDAFDKVNFILVAIIFFCHTVSYTSVQVC